MGDPHISFTAVKMVEIETPDAEELGGNVTKPFKFVTVGYDARFPNTNQTKHYWQNYVDYHKCILAKGEDFKPCRQFYLAYRSLCPSAWCERWDDQRENGTFPTRLDQQINLGNGLVDTDDGERSS